MGDEIDFDDLLADAEQEADMYDDSRDDYDREAEMAMEAEVSMRFVRCTLLIVLPLVNSPRDIQDILQFALLVLFTLPVLTKSTPVCLGADAGADPREASNLTAVEVLQCRRSRQERKPLIASEDPAAIRTQKQARPPCWHGAPIFRTCVPDD